MHPFKSKVHFGHLGKGLHTRGSVAAPAARGSACAERARPLAPAPRRGAAQAGPHTACTSNPNPSPCPCSVAPYRGARAPQQLLNSGVAPVGSDAERSVPALRQGGAKGRQAGRVVWCHSVLVACHSGVALDTRQRPSRHGDGWRQANALVHALACKHPWSANRRATPPCAEPSVAHRSHPPRGVPPGDVDSPLTSVPASLSAPASNSTTTVEKCPSQQARWSGVLEPCTTERQQQPQASAHAARARLLRPSSLGASVRLRSVVDVSGGGGGGGTGGGGGPGTAGLEWAVRQRATTANGRTIPHAWASRQTPLRSVRPIMTRAPILCTTAQMWEW